MWPMMEHRNKNRRLRKPQKERNLDRRKTERRSLIDWIDLYLNDDNPHIS